jgi:hypothetical protein
MNHEAAKPTKYILQPPILLALLVLFLIPGAGLAAANLLVNGQMEGAKAGALPPGWGSITMGAPARFTTDTTDKHAGQASVRIEAPKQTRSYLRSMEGIPVVPDETIDASAWVKIKNVPAGHGGVMLIAEFSSADRSWQTVDKFAMPDANKQGQWVHLSGSLKTPARAAALHIRMGFSYSSGICWWDDVTVSATRALVCRVGLPTNELLPAMRTLPVEVLNRTGQRGEVTIRILLNKRPSLVHVTLSGKPTQVVQVPIEVANPGKAQLSIEMLKTGESRPIYSMQQQMKVPPPLVLGVPSPTHWAIEDGPPKLEGKIELAVKDLAGAARELRLQLQTSDGKPVPAGAMSKSFANGSGTFALSFAHPLPAGDYKLIAEIPTSHGKPLHQEQPWHVIHREQSKVTLNDAGYPVYEGKAIFPLGIFNGSRFKEQAAAGFTVTHAYNAVRLQEDPDHADENALRYLDNTEKYGMKMLFMVPMKEVIKGDWEAVRRRVRMFRNHPALLAWDEEEGFARGDFKPDTLKTLRKLLQEEDPNHPFTVGDPREPITQVPPNRSNFFPVSEMDLGMWWWYPFPLQSKTRGTLLGGDEGAPGSELVPPSFLVNAHISKPLWVGVQSYKKPTPDGRFPTPAEYRAQAYLALISGAKGLMWYGGSVEGGIFIGNNPVEGHWDALQKLASELHGLGDVLMSPSLETPKVSANQVSAMLKQSQNGFVLVAVNRGGSPVEVSLTSPHMKTATAKVLEESRAVPIRDQALRDRFEPYATHVYEWGD